LGMIDYLKGIFGVQTKSDRITAWLANNQPVFTQFGNNIYLSDFVNNAIDRVATEISKINVKSVVDKGDSLMVQNDDITRLFRSKPNPLQTTSDFLSSVEWLRRKNRNAFIYPQYEIVETPTGRRFRRYTAFYPLNPQAVYIGVTPGGNVWEVKMDFEDGSSWVIPYADLVHMKWRRGNNLIVGGGDDYGQADDKDVLNTIRALDKTIQGLPKSIEASLQIKGVYYSKSLLDEKRRESERADFESHILTSKTGIVATDLAGEFTPMDIKPPDIPEDVMKFLKAVIQERYGISAAVLSGDYTSTQHNAFYQTAIEDFIIQFEQAMTSTLFTQREQDVGRRVKCYYQRVRYYSVTDKHNLADLATKTGILTLNQINELFGYEPFDGGDVRLRSLNYIDASIANEYQMANKSKLPDVGLEDEDEE
jgi:HK97 family phage portal protein